MAWEEPITIQSLVRLWNEYKRHRIGRTQEDSDRPNLYFDDFMDWLELNGKNDI